MFSNESIHCFIGSFPGVLPDKGMRRRRRRYIRHGRDNVVLVLDVDQQFVLLDQSLRLITCGLLYVRLMSNPSDQDDNSRRGAIRETYCKTIVVSKLSSKNQLMYR